MSADEVAALLYLRYRRLLRQKNPAPAKSSKAPPMEIPAIAPALKLESDENEDCECPNAGEADERDEPGELWLSTPSPSGPASSSKYFLQREVSGDEALSLA